MRVLGTDLIDGFVGRHPAAQAAFAKWLTVVRDARWTNPMQVKQTFNHADFLGDGRIIFDIGGNKYRLFAIAEYQAGALRIRWVGTHAEYDKLNFKN